MDEGNAFIAAMTEYSKALCAYTHKCEDELKNGRKPIKVQIIRARSLKAKPTRPGKRTAFMESQLSIFRAYLEKHPVTQSYSLINRARECWRLHKAEWDKAAKSGEGYSCYKALSSAV